MDSSVPVQRVAITDPALTAPVLSSLPQQQDLTVEAGYLKRFRRGAQSDPAQVGQVQKHSGAEVEAGAVLISEKSAGAEDGLFPLSEGLRSSCCPV